MAIPRPSVEAHKSLLQRLYSVRTPVVAAGTAGLLLVGGVAAWQTNDAVLLTLTLIACVANALLLWVVATADVPSAASSSELRRLEQRFSFAGYAGCAAVSAMTSRALVATEDPLVHLALVSLGLSAVATCLRNYFSPGLVPRQIALLLYPPSFAMALQERPIYWALALGGLFLGYVISRIAQGMYAEALASIQKDEALHHQNIRFEAALGNMAQGLCMFDEAGRLVVCNQRYRDIYGFSADVVKPGVTLREVLEHSRSVGNHPRTAVDQLFERFTKALAVAFPTNIENDLGNGRTVALAHRPLEGGGWVTTHEDITERKATADRVAHLARHDPLTDLPNRTFFSETLEQWLQAEDSDLPVAAFCLDLDGFKAVNDTLGHAAGDALLKHVAARIRSCGGEKSFIARLGGDEFAIVQRRVEQPAGATALAEEILTALSNPFDVEGRQITVGVSIGISIAAARSCDANKLIRNADLALYRAKSEGRGQYQFFAAEMDEWLHTRRHLEVDLRRAVSDGQLTLLYQPVFDARTHSITCFEALLRWHHPKRGIILPSDFVPIAEETGLIASIGEWVIRSATLESRNWPQHIRLAVNLSPAQISSPNLLSTITRALAAAQLPPDRFELEVTENVLLGDAQVALTKLHTLRSMGVKIVMDDFGTGYSSLSNLRAFPFDKIKIDRSFVSDLAADPDALAIVRAVRDLGRTFAMSVTAEGVETEAQLEQLEREGCDELQGFLLGAPLPASELKAFIEATPRRKAA
jgi:diguanylate cyclase (GGDEF)-like protein/PAS domain S-box-containing protein